MVDPARMVKRERRETRGHPGPWELLGYPGLRDQRASREIRVTRYSSLLNAGHSYCKLFSDSSVILLRVELCNLVSIEKLLPRLS